ncbi:MAG: chromosomal replication initiator protein DnaA, partial [Planctomycetota bacterium]|nr:chromosomal replication initiator protein DnaA [Planctomycetota bacterium]
ASRGCDALKVGADGVVQDVASGDKEILVKLRDALTHRLGQERYELWFGARTRFLVDDGLLTVEVATAFFHDWLRTNFRDALQHSAAEVLGSTVEIAFRINADLSDETDEETASSEEEDQHPALDQLSSPHAAGTTASRQPASGQGRSQAAGRAPHAAGPASAPFSDFESFAVGHCNRVAFASAQLAAEQPGSVTPLYLWGGTGVGKTHLQESIWSAFQRQSPKSSAVMLAAEQFTSLFVEALHHSGLPSFRRKYRSVQLLMIDDIQFFDGKKATVGELLHTIDTLLRTGRQVVLAADRPPGQLDGLGPEITSRLVGGNVCRMDPPDMGTRREIVRGYVQRRGCAVPDDVQDLVAGRFNENARELFGAVNRLQATSQATGEPITLAMAEEALSDLIVHNSRVIHLSDIEKAVCETFGLRPESLRSQRKAKSVSHPRMLAMWLARKHTRSALSEIGDYFGRRSHTTVISAQKRVNSWMSVGDSLAVADRQWHVEEAVRRVEEKLRAG